MEQADGLKVAGLLVGFRLNFSATETTMTAMATSLTEFVSCFRAGSLAGFVRVMSMM